MFLLKTTLIEALAVMMLAQAFAQTASDPKTNSIGLKMIPVKAGSFTMGSATRDDNWNERPAHKVTISEGFLMSETEVTLEQFQKFRRDFEGTPGCDPYVAGVSWNDATAFCEWLSKQEGKPYRLPTEAEWEYACRAGTVTPFSSGDQPPAPETANAWGLKNMHTGVREWCFDRYGEYPLESQIDPAGADQGITRVVRGGGMDENKPEYARSAARASVAERFGVGQTENAERQQVKLATTFFPGMVGRFFGEPDLTRPHDKFLIHKLDLSKKDGEFDKGSQWSGRFLGFIEAPVTGSVTFEGIADDGMEVSVEGKKIISAWNQKNQAVAGTVDMVKGRKYEVEITYTQNGGEAFMRLYWSWAGQEKQIVPSPAMSYNGIQETKVVAMGTGATSEVPGHHLIGFRVVQAAPATQFRQTEAPYASQGVRQDKSMAKLGPDLARPYFRKRYMMPTPLENSDRKFIDAAGLHPSFREHNHSPAVEVLPNGDVLMVIYTSYNEYEPGVSLIAARLRFGTEEWDMPSPWVDFSLVNDHAPLLWVDQGVLRLFWGNPRLASAFPFQWVESTDNGATLGPVHFPSFTSPIGPHSKQPINTAFRGNDGTMYVASDAAGATSVLWASRDDGKTWYDTGGRSAGRHTTYALLMDGSILGMGGKNSEIEGYMPKAVSKDGGKSWEKSKTPFAALSANQRPSLLRLASGRLFFAGDFQDFHGRQPDGIRQRGSYVALSEDEGQTWTIKPLLGAQPHENGKLESATLGYSAARQAPNGVIHLITTMNRPCLHFEMNEAWILNKNATRDDPMASTSSGPLLSVKQHEEKYPNGQPRLIWSAGKGSDGRYLLDGREVWFYDNGQKQREANYEKGFKAGKETYWSREGKVEWTWEHRPDGSAVWSQFWSNGQKKSVSTWRNFMCDGAASCWDPSGKQISQATFSMRIVKK
ncbi:MAG: hypothetical protein FJ387_12610 [Verrucomicrobia bacterium]|nr:hypothetical protein [Verrucomicrobiota bacterium]